MRLLRGLWTATQILGDATGIAFKFVRRPQPRMNHPDQRQISQHTPSGLSFPSDGIAAIAANSEVAVSAAITTAPTMPAVLLEPGVDPVPRPCAVNLDSVESVSTDVLVERLGRLADDRMQQVCGALAVAVDCQG